MQDALHGRPATFGLIGFLIGAASIVVILIQLSALFEPQEKTSGAIIGEIAADIKQSAARALSGEPAPEPTQPRQDYSQIVTIAAICAAGVAIVLGGMGFYRNEPPRLPFLAIGVGFSAIILQYVFWLAILICGVALLISIVGNLDSILG